jgi:hypothetical protein
MGRLSSVQPVTSDITNNIANDKKNDFFTLFLLEFLFLKTVAVKWGQLYWVGNY